MEHEYMGHNLTHAEGFLLSKYTNNEGTVRTVPPFYHQMVPVTISVAMPGVTV
jgi:hypothetical protein